MHVVLLFLRLGKPIVEKIRTLQPEFVLPLKYLFRFFHLKDSDC